MEHKLNKSISKQQKLLQKLVMMDMTKACYNLGYMYQNGFELDLILKKALELYEKVVKARMGLLFIIWQICMKDRWIEKISLKQLII